MSLAAPPDARRSRPGPSGHGRITMGRVTLVGAGPGDPDLLTLKAVRALQSADVILFDDLVSDAVLDLARREAKKLLVGKRGGRASCPQDEINALMVKLALAGRHIVRLKSGDPTVFGRAGEEIEVLRAAGIEAEIVPGITAASALAASLGISLTHRDHSHSVRLVTGHGRDGGLPALDWRGLADPQTSLLVYMGGSTAAEFALGLIEHGLPASTPAVIAEAVSRPEQSLLATTLGELAAGPIERGDGPVLIGIGTAFAAASLEAGRSATNHPDLLFGT